MSRVNTARKIFWLFLSILLVWGLTILFTPPILVHSGDDGGNATSAEKAMKTLVDAEKNFRTADYDGDGPDFAYNLSQLHDQKNSAGKEIGLIPSRLANGEKEGYSYNTLATYDTAGGTDPRYGFAYIAIPTQYGVTGRRSYVVNHTGEIFYKDRVAAAAISTRMRWPDTANDTTWTLLGE